MKVTLTFDNGPTAEETPHVLKVLERHSVPPTFFVLGKQLADPSLRALTVEAKDAGHRIGNHGYSHAIPFGELANPQEAIEEIVRTQELIGDLAGDELLYRTFGGGGHIDGRLFNYLAIEHLQRERYTIALWTSVPRDREDVEGWVDTAIADCA